MSAKKKPKKRRAVPRKSPRAAVARGSDDDLLLDAFRSALFWTAALAPDAHTKMRALLGEVVTGLAFHDVAMLEELARVVAKHARRGRAFDNHHRAYGAAINGIEEVLPNASPDQIVSALDHSMTPPLPVTLGDKRRTEIRRSVEDYVRRRRADGRVPDAQTIVHRVLKIAGVKDDAIERLRDAYRDRFR